MLTADHRTGIFRTAQSLNEQAIVMEDEPRLPAMPKAPTLFDFFRFRFGDCSHLLQSARLARLAGQSEKTVLACLLHDIAVFGFVRGDHGFWGEQMVAPYVDEEVSWAIRAHQALRFFPDESVGYTYPQAYIDYFGPDYVPDDYIRYEYEQAKNNPWYMTARMITIYDIYSFDPNVTVDLEDFTDIVGRHFRQPEEGLGWDNSPCAHIWRTIRRPSKFL
jgi:hypothetical protein